MLATRNCSNRYTKSRIYENNWINDHNIQIPWLQFLITQPIPEETDIIDSPKRIHTDSDCSSSSTEDCYVILEIQQPHSTKKELNFAQIHEDKHHVEYEQFAQSMIIEIPLKENAVEYQSKEILLNKQYIQVSKNILFHTPKKPDRSVSISNENSQLTPSFSLTSHPVQTQQEKSTLTRTCMTNYNVKENSSSPFYLDNKSNPDANSLISNDFSKTPAFLRLIKKRSRIINSEYYLSNDEIQSTEPSLLQIKYLDGGPTLTDLNALESFKKSQLLTNSISSRLASSINLSYRKRLLNPVQTFLNPTSTEQSKSWQHKTIFELFNERKNKINSC